MCVWMYVCICIYLYIYNIDINTYIYTHRPGRTTSVRSTRAREWSRSARANRPSFWTCRKKEKRRWCNQPYRCVVNSTNTHRWSGLLSWRLCLRVSLCVCTYMCIYMYVWYMCIYAYTGDLDVVWCGVLVFVCMIFYVCGVYVYVWHIHIYMYACIGDHVYKHTGDLDVWCGV